MNGKIWMLGAALLVVAGWMFLGRTSSAEERTYAVAKTDAEWRQQLGNDRYHVLREKGTERSFTGKFWDYKLAGTYVCAGCANPLFSSTTKYKSGTGWPSYSAPYSPEAVDRESDYSLGIPRVEVLCSQCGGHLGHVFGDGPKPTGQRYCINSASLNFVPDYTDPAPQETPSEAKK